jgi:homogentisate 1,2-dioxygenase
MKILENSISFMFKLSRAFTISESAWNGDKKHEHQPKMSDNLVDNFSTYANEIHDILSSFVRGSRNRMGLGSWTVEPVRMIHDTFSEGGK